jgi:hypothetical protein
MAAAISSRPPDDVSNVIPKREKLPPCPEGEVIAIASTNSLENFRRHPVIVYAELFFV